MPEIRGDSVPVSLPSCGDCEPSPPRAATIWFGSKRNCFRSCPGSFESVLARLGIRYAVDYDDATFHRYDGHGSAVIRALFGTKLKPLIHGACLLTCGSRYLVEAAAVMGGTNVRFVPTVVDLDRYPLAEAPGGESLRIGWIGSPSTTPSLAVVARPLEALAQSMPVQLVTIGAGPLPEVRVPTETHPWREETESALLRTIDIGIMPLTNSPWQRGKCGFKLIQYMACGRPVIASPVGANNDIVTDDTGFLAKDEDAWLQAFYRLARDRALRRKLGLAGRARVEQCYSLQHWAPRIVEMLDLAYDLER